PPKDALEFMKLMNLRKGVGQYLDDKAHKKDAKRFRPFSESWEVAASAYPPSAFREWGPRGPEDNAKTPPFEVLEKAVQAPQPWALLAAAKKLDAFLNNQSLVVLFTFRGKKLLFAGDAQAGNWENWLYDGDTPTTTPDAKLGKQSAAVLGSL